MSEPTPSGLEKERIRAAYARRHSTVDPQTYSHFNRGNLFIIQERERHILKILGKHGFQPLAERRILEVGCGAGFWLRAFLQWGARPEHLVGIDLLPERLEAARRVCPRGVSLLCGDAAELPFPDARFDLVLQSTVFSSVLDGEIRQRVAREMLRVLSPQGAILWYDFFVDNPRNPDVRGIRQEEIRRLFPPCDFVFRRVTLAPPLARALAGRCWLLCEFLAILRILNTHYLVLIRCKK